jgi:hypothetical protein
VIFAGDRCGQPYTEGSQKLCSCHKGSLMFLVQTQLSFSNVVVSSSMPPAISMHAALNEFSVLAIRNVQVIFFYKFTWLSHFQ